MRYLVFVLMLILVFVPFGHVHSQTSDCTHHKESWHPPVDGVCVYEHEHGDQPPQWIADAGYVLAFDHEGGFHGNTSTAENVLKHNSMKGMLATFGNQQVYIRVHIASNVLERMSRYHSYEMFLQDSVGNVSHWQGWFNSGEPDPQYGQRRSKSLPDSGVRPMVLVTDYDALVKGLNCEQWYGFTNAWGPDIGWTICDSTTMYYPQELQLIDESFWIKLCDYGYDKNLCKGADREIELAWYGPDNTASPNRGNPPKDVKFWATQFGEIVSGPTSNRCTAQTTKFTVNYNNICLEQYIASTARSIVNPNNRFRKTYDVTGVQSRN